MSKRSLYNADRYLVVRGGVYHYKRRVPTPLIHLDARAPKVRISLGTKEQALARMKRDEYEYADDVYWAKLTLGENSDTARHDYLLAVKRAEANGFTYRPGRLIAAEPNVDHVLKRIETIIDERTPIITAKAVLGHEEPAAVTISEAFRVYCEDIVHDELKNKSPMQKKHWMQVKERAVNNFIGLVGDKPINQITKDDANKLKKLWVDRVAPKDGSAPTHKPNSANRDIGNMRKLLREYYGHLGEPERFNPFDKLRLKDDGGSSRLPIPTQWIKEKYLQPSKLANLNDEARAVFLALIETGARPSELLNLVKTQIALDHPVPHVMIKMRNDPDDPREIKTKNSKRALPLVGVALDAFRKFPNGFPTYKDKEDTFSATVNKFLRENDLVPEQKEGELPYTLYCLRHSFEDRMKVAGIGDEMRKIIFGHGREREIYGEGGELEWRQGLLKKMALPYEPSIV